MTLTVVWHKPCWQTPASPTGYAALGGLPLQVAALSELFDATRIVSPVVVPASTAGETPIAGHNVSVVPLAWLPRIPVITWLALPLWAARSLPRLTREVARADAVYALVPSPIGIIGLVLAVLFGKRLVTRQLSAWDEPRLSWRLVRRLLERTAGGRRVVFATGGGSQPPSARNPAIRWLFTTTVTECERAAPAPVRQCDPGRPPRLMLAGREIDVKATLVALRACAILAREYPGLSLEVIGNGAALAKVRTLTRTLALPEGATFHGPVGHTRVIELLRRADLFCMPAADTEAFRQAVHEAIACGLPVIAPADAVLPAIVESGCVEPLAEVTPEALAAAVRACWSDPVRYQRMSSEARCAAEPYTVERWSAVMATALEEAWGPLRAART